MKFHLRKKQTSRRRPLALAAAAVVAACAAVAAVAGRRKSRTETEPAVGETPAPLAPVPGAPKAG